MKFLRKEGDALLFRLPEVPVFLSALRMAHGGATAASMQQHQSDESEAEDAILVDSSDDEVIVRMRLGDLAQNRMVLLFEYYRVNRDREELLARGEQQVACMERRSTSIGREILTEMKYEMMTETNRQAMAIMAK